MVQLWQFEPTSHEQRQGFTRLIETTENFNMKIMKNILQIYPNLKNFKAKVG